MDLREQLQKSLGEAFRLERELGGGGMSRVFVAEDASLGRKVVIKILPAELAAGVSIERFKREIALAARLQHPHIVPLFSAGDVDGLPYFTMPLIEGESLRNRLAKKGELPLNEAVRVMREVASALDYAHEKGVVHRDIKPDNVLLSRGSAMVTDFGVAKALSASSNAENSGMTSLGVALGTPAYMSPEQASADPNADHRADIYAFGVLAYELLTGQPPFAGRTPQGLLAAHVTESPEHVSRRRSTIPVPLATLVMRCLEKRPADRPQTAQEVVHALDAINTPSGGMEPTREAMAVQVASQALDRSVSRVMRIAVAAAAIGVVALLGWKILGSDRGTGAAPAATAAQRVAVATFQNKSGDKSLDPVGDMAADWIARGLAGTGIVDVAGTATELEAGSATKTSDPAALGRLAKAGIVISGAYYKQGDSLIFQADFTDVANGKLVQSVGPITSTIGRPLDGVEVLRQRVTGALAPMIDSTLSGLSQAVNRPPSYEAYRAFLRGEALFYQDDSAAALAFSQAVELDTSYAYPKLRLMGVLSNGNRLREADSLRKLIEPRRRSLSAYEQAYFDFLNANLVGDYPRSLAAVERMGALAPSSPFPLYGQANALNYLARPRRALQILDGLDPKSGALRGRLYIYQYYHWALHALGDYERDLRMAKQGRDQYPNRLITVSSHAAALSVLGRTDELMRLLDSAATMPRDRNVIGPVQVGLQALWEAKSHDRPNVVAAIVPWLEREIQRDGRRQSQLARMDILYMTDRWQALAAIADSVIARDSIVGMRWGGIAEAKLGNRAKAQALEKRLSAMMATPLRSGALRNEVNRREAILRGRAEILAALGDFASATALLKERDKPGWEQTLYHNAPAFDLLRAYPGFQELLVPKG